MRVVGTKNPLAVGHSPLEQRECPLVVADPAVTDREVAGRSESPMLSGIFNNLLATRSGDLLIGQLTAWLAGFPTAPGSEGSSAAVSALNSRPGLPRTASQIVT